LGRDSSGAGGRRGQCFGERGGHSSWDTSGCYRDWKLRAMRKIWPGPGHVAAGARGGGASQVSVCLWGQRRGRGHGEGRGHDRTGAGTWLEATARAWPRRWLGSFSCLPATPGSRVHAPQATPPSRSVPRKSPPPLPLATSTRHGNAADQQFPFMPPATPTATPTATPPATPPAMPPATPSATPSATVAASNFNLFREDYEHTVKYGTSLHGELFWGGVRVPRADGEPHNEPLPCGAIPRHVGGGMA
jgi:hypothetical protein